MEENGSKLDPTTNKSTTTVGKEDETTSKINEKRLAEIEMQLKLQIQENQKIQNEFNGQRAKLKDLFMQKESEYAKCQAEREALQRELDEMKSQFLVADLKLENEMLFKDMKAQEEITSLQQMLQDTIEESSQYKAEMEAYQLECQRISQQYQELRESLQQQQQQQAQHHHQQHESTTSTSLAPQMLSQMKTIVRKLGGESNSMLGTSFHQDSIDDSKSNKGSGKQYAHEDAEVLRSIVVQLQEEMKALKEKLREADEKLQLNSNKAENDATLQHSKQSKIGDISTPLEPVANCSTCSSYETKIQQLLEKSTEEKEKIEYLQKGIEDAEEELKKEAALRKDLEDQWQEKREAHKTEVQILREHVKTNGEKLLNLQQKFLETEDDVVRQLQRLSDERERVNKHLETLQADNEFLSGHYLATSQEIENQQINLPNNVQDLHELLLLQRSELIQARVGREFGQRQLDTNRDEIEILREQLDASNNERRTYKKTVQTEIKSLQDRLTEHLLTLSNYEANKNALEREKFDLNRQISELRVEIIELQESNEKLNKMNAELKNKMKILHDELATGEQVQKDFVKLSQRLQMSLEQLRHADTEVRWQDDDDVNNCPTCKTYFTVTVRKIHCRHCGHIYCDKCLTKTVPSGPRKRIARVCDICHTLLTPNTAPYFSQESTMTST